MRLDSFLWIETPWRDDRRRDARVQHKNLNSFSRRPRLRSGRAGRRCTTACGDERRTHNDSQRHATTHAERRSCLRAPTLSSHSERRRARFAFGLSLDGGEQIFGWATSVTGVAGRCHSLRRELDAGTQRPCRRQPHQLYAYSSTPSRKSMAPAYGDVIEARLATRSYLRTRTRRRSIRAGNCPQPDPMQKPLTAGIWG